MAKPPIASHIEWIEKFFQRSVCENMQRYILGGTKVSRYVNQIPNYVVYINNVLSLAFIFARGCLRSDIDSEKPISQSVSKQSSFRIINSLQKAYVQYPVTSELIQFVLSDIQFEMLNGPTGELYEMFENLCKFSSKDFSLSKYYKLVAQWKAAPSRFNMDSTELVVMFETLLKHMAFIRNYQLTQDEDGSFSFVNKEALEFDSTDEKYASIPVGHLIYFNLNQYLEMFSLFNIEKSEEDGVKRLGMRYITGNGHKSLYFVVSDEEDDAEGLPEHHIQADADDYYYQTLGEDWDYVPEDQQGKKNSNFIDQVHAVNYKYIKNLALAISDTIGTQMGSKTALYNAYHQRYKDIFKDITSLIEATGSDAESIKVDWDSIILMLLIESSPTSVLETLFRASRQTFVEIAKNLCKRIDNPQMSIYGKSDDELRQMVQELIKTKLVFGDAEGFGKIPQAQSGEKLFARAASLLLISSLSSVVEGENVEKTLCAGNIYDNISFLKRMKSDIPDEQRCKYVCIILSETFRHLLCFYRGLLGYGEIKGVFDVESCNRCFSENEIATYQKKMHLAFMEAAKQEADAIKHLNSSEHADMLQLLKRFIALCSDCSSSVNATTAGHHLYTVLGKHELLNVNEFETHINLFLSNCAEINENNVDDWSAFALDILRYLRKGSFKSKDDSVFRTIYPFTATYNRGNENYDGYKTITFSLNIDVTEGEKSDSKQYINVLSEFNYNLSNVFYCLPNVLRSNNKWWIDPLLVNLKDFNDIFIE